MSWNDYISKSLQASGQVHEASILGHDGSPWAASSGFNIAKDEFANIFKGFSEQSGLYQTGIRLNGKKYMFINSPDDGVLVGKLGGDAGCVIERTTRAVIVSTFTAGMTAGNCRNTVGKLAEYLKNSGY